MKLVAMGQMILTNDESEGSATLFDTTWGLGMTLQKSQTSRRVCLNEAVAVWDSIDASCFAVAVCCCLDGAYIGLFFWGGNLIGYVWDYPFWRQSLMFSLQVISHTLPVHDVEALWPLVWHGSPAHGKQQRSSQEILPGAYPC